jgi:hypothetical protein
MKPELPLLVKTTVFLYHRTAAMSYPFVIVVVATSFLTSEVSHHQAICAKWL